MAHYYQLISELHALGFKQTKCVHMEAKERGDAAFRDARHCQAFDWPERLDALGSHTPFMRVHVSFKQFQPPHRRDRMPTIFSVYVHGTGWDRPQRVSADNAIDAAKRFVRIHDKRP